MKKTMGLLALLMVLSLFTGALASTGDMDLFYGASPEQGNDLSIRAAASDSNSFYALTFGEGEDGWLLYRLFRYDYQTQTTEMLADDLPMNLYDSIAEFEKIGEGDINRLVNKLFVSDGELFCLNNLTGTVSLLTYGDGTLVFTPVGVFDNRAFITITRNGVNKKLITSVIKQGDSLYVSTYDKDAKPRSAVLHFDLKTGAYQTLSDIFVQTMMPYQEDTVLAFVFDPLDEKSRAQKPYEVHTLNLATGDSERLYALEPYAFGLAYDAQNDAMYYAKDGQVKVRKAHGSVESVANLPTSSSHMYYSCDYAAYENGLYSVASALGFSVRNTER